MVIVERFDTSAGVTYSATADLTTCPPWARVLEVAASRRFQADKTSQVAKIEVGVGTNFKPQES